jgi:hypothetical protein
VGVLLLPPVMTMTTTQVALCLMLLFLSWWMLPYSLRAVRPLLGMEGGQHCWCRHPPEDDDCRPSVGPSIGDSW